MACESGTSPAPKMPCMTRNSTISVSEVAAPQSIEASVKPITMIMNSRRRPSRAARMPVGGVMIAAATI